MRDDNCLVARELHLGPTVAHGVPILRLMTTFHDVGQDLAYAVRILSRNPGFTLVAILTIALGIGVNTTLFSIVNAVALKPLPVAQPDEVVRLKRWFETGSQGDIQ